MPHRAERGQATSEFSKVNRPLPLVNLDGISPAERNARPPFAGKMDEVMLAARPAPRERVARCDFREGIVPYVVGQQGVPKLVPSATSAT